VEFDFCNRIDGKKTESPHQKDMDDKKRRERKKESEKKEFALIKQRVSI
jgi:hypothetical protein